MVWQIPLLSAVPSGVVDMTADFAPLFVGMVIGIGLCVLALAFMIGVHDVMEAKRNVKQETDLQPSLPKAA
ncbi:MAG TPA: hypothetical protein VKK81_15170 [Candidatus Binatia bacterium]|nr:hypothetical protein [Candidatus Binatia bacterium]